MKKIKELECPIPPVTSFPLLANMMSVLWTNPHDTMGWISEHFIQLISQPTIDLSYSQYINFYDYEIAYNRPIFMNCPFIDCSRFHRNILYFEKKFVFSKFVQKSLLNEYYIHIPIDQYYLSQAPLYLKKHFVHSAFIHGFDGNGFFIRDFFQGKYRQLYASEKELNQAFEGYEYDPQNEYTSYISLLRYRSNQHKCNKQKVLLDYSDYLSGNDSYKRYSTDSHYRTVSFAYGVSCYDVLKNFLKNNSINIKPYHIVYDHKVFQEYRMIHLFELGYIKNSNLIDVAKKIKNDALLLRNLALNLMVSYSTNHAQQAIILCDKIQQTECNLIEQVIDELK